MCTYARHDALLPCSPSYFSKEQNAVQDNDSLPRNIIAYRPTRRVSWEWNTAWVCDLAPLERLQRIGRQKRKMACRCSRPGDIGYKYTHHLSSCPMFYQLLQKRRQRRTFSLLKLTIIWATFNQEEICQHAINVVQLVSSYRNVTKVLPLYELQVAQVQRLVPCWKQLDARELMVVKMLPLDMNSFSQEF